MILGDICTRGCRFCSVTTGRPQFDVQEFAGESEQVADAAVALGLKHVVVTSVARDDLPDGGASGFVSTIAALRRRLPATTVEVLIPDFRGNGEALRAVVEAGPDVVNHNLETVPRLYRRVRPGSSYVRSLELLKEVKQISNDVLTKTGIMLGLGEEREEVESLLRDCRDYGVESFTAGQYMRPTRQHLPVERYLPPGEYESLAAFAKSLGFRHVAAGPLVRSSYHAEEFID